MTIIRILVTVFMVLLWTVFMFEGVKQPSPKVRAGYWIVATVVCAFIIFRTWDCPGWSLVCVP